MTVNVASATWNSAKTVATLTLANNLTAGNYSVQVGGVGLATGADTATVTAQDQKVASIKFLSSNAVENAGGTAVTIGYQIFNQYGEDITTAGLATLTPTASSGSPVASNGTLTVTGTFNVDYKLAVTLLDTGSGSFASDAAAISTKSQVASITVTKLYDTTTKGRTPTVGDTSSDYELVLSAVDQYGNAVTDTTQLNRDVVVSDSNSSVSGVAGSIATDSINGTTVPVLKLSGTIEIPHLSQRRSYQKWNPARSDSFHNEGVGTDEPVVLTPKGKKWVILIRNAHFFYRESAV